MAKWNLSKTVTVCTLLAMTGCVAHTWAPGPNQTAANFGQASGQCKLMAMGAGTTNGFVGAAGRPAFVGAFVSASILASAAASAVRQNQAYNACMEASGFVAADGQPQ
jgi:hypothetical protein